MFLLKKFAMVGIMLTAVCAVSACDSVLFPEYDDEDVYVGEGGRVIRTIPTESKSLGGDNVHAAYEGAESPETLRPVKVPAAPVPAADKIKPTHTVAVKKDTVKPAKKQMKTPAVGKTLEEEEKSLDADEFLLGKPAAEEKKAKTAAAQKAEPEFPAEESAGPSVSYRIDTFLFANGSSELGGENLNRIHQIVKEAKAHNAQVIVYGYASSRTRNTDPASHKLANFKVSLERANSVAKALKRAGLPASKIEVQAMSDTAPMYQEVMPEGERLNRRAEVYISY